MDERDERTVIPRRAELDGIACPAKLAQAYRVAVEGSLGVEISDGELDGSDRGRRIDRQSGSTPSPTRTTPGCSTPPHTPIGSGSSPSVGR